MATLQLVFRGPRNRSLRRSLDPSSPAPRRDSWARRSCGDPPSILEARPSTHSRAAGIYLRCGDGSSGGWGLARRDCRSGSGAYVQRRWAPEPTDEDKIRRRLAELEAEIEELEFR